MTATNKTYAAYALRISSPVQLPGLRQTNGDPDVTIEYGSVDSDTGRGAERDETRLSYDGIGEFEICDGTRVVIDPAEGVGDVALQPYLIGPVMGAILHQQGYLVLHASSVSMRGTAVTFLGPSGAGKSTIAAACQMEGHDVLSDDVTAVEVADGKPNVVPGSPLLKLTPEFADVFDIDYEYLSAGPRDKNLYRVPGGVPRSTLPLKRLYIVADGNLQSTELSPDETVQALVGHTYTASLLDESSIGTHFRQCTRVAGTARICRLSRPRGFEALLDTVQQIEREVC